MENGTECGRNRVSLTAEGWGAHHRRMYHYDPETALEELNEDAVLPHPVHVRDMIVRAKLSPDRALELNRKFQSYLHDFGELQNLVRPVLDELAKLKQP
jgi:hypothetical protein